MATWDKATPCRPAAAGRSAILLGARIGGMCMSEPGYGTDVLGMKTTATRDGDSCALIRLFEKILHTSLCAATAYPLLLPWVLLRKFADSDARCAP